MDFPGTKAPVAPCFRRTRLTLARVWPMQPTIALCCMPSRASASSPCLMPMGLDGALLEQSVRIEKKIFQCWFELATVQRQIWGIHLLSWSFGLWRSHLALNTLRPRQNGRHFFLQKVLKFIRDSTTKNSIQNDITLHYDIFKSIFLNENAGILLKIPLKFVPKVRINNIPALVQIMAWRRPGDKPLS